MKVNSLAHNSRSHLVVAEVQKIQTKGVFKIATKKPREIVSQLSLEPEVKRVKRKVLHEHTHTFIPFDNKQFTKSRFFFTNYFLLVFARGGFPIGRFLFEGGCLLLLLRFWRLLIGFSPFFVFHHDISNSCTLLMQLKTERKT